MSPVDRSHVILLQLEKLVAHVIHQLLHHFSQPPSKPLTKLPSYPKRLYLSKTPHKSLIVLRIAYLASLSHAHIRQNRLLTKRDVYYMCRTLFPNTMTVDRALEALSKLLNVPRNDLHIVAAPKGLVSGTVSFVDEAHDSVHVAMFGANGCIIPPRPERMLQVTTDAYAIVVFEKEASFHSLLHEPAAQQLLETCIFVTGKGYPDVATRMFLARVSSARLAQGNQIPIYVLTDADPHGISIAFCYIRDLPNCLVKWAGVRPSDNGKYFWLKPASLLPVTSNENSLMDGMLQNMKQGETCHPERVASLKKEILVLKTTQTKFEMEALAVEDFGSPESALLKYLLERTQEESVVAKESQCA